MPLAKLLFGYESELYSTEYIKLNTINFHKCSFYYKVPLFRKKKYIYLHWFWKGWAPLLPDSDVFFFVFFFRGAERGCKTQFVRFWRPQPQLQWKQSTWNLYLQKYLIQYLPSTPSLIQTLQTWKKSSPVSNSKWFCQVEWFTLIVTRASRWLLYPYSCNPIVTSLLTHPCKPRVSKHNNTRRVVVRKKLYSLQRTSSLQLCRRNTP